MADLGFSVNTHKHTVSNATLKKFAKFAVANISDAVSRTNGTVDLRPIHKGGRILGRAFTVKTAPGDVIVVDAGGLQRNAIIGEIMSTLAASRKIAGFVIDGPIRDFDALSKGKFPVFARSVSHRGPYKEGPGEINVTVCVDGMVVHPGDIIVGDQDGVFAIRPEMAEQLAKLVADIEKKEKEIFAKIAKGTLDRSWVDQSLRAKGVLK